jgi:hypothetical protein
MPRSAAGTCHRLPGLTSLKFRPAPAGLNPNPGKCEMNPVFTCPDRSWCRTTQSGTRESGGTGRPGPRDGLQEAHLPSGGEGTRIEEGRVSASRGRGGARQRQRIKPLTRAPALHSVALRANQASLKKAWRKLHTPLDNHHGRCSAWLANQPRRTRSNDARNG